MLRQSRIVKARAIVLYEVIGDPRVPQAEQIRCIMDGIDLAVENLLDAESQSGGKVHEAYLSSPDWSHSELKEHVASLANTGVGRELVGFDFGALLKALIQQLIEAVGRQPSLDDGL